MFVVQNDLCCTCVRSLLLLLAFRLLRLHVSLFSTFVPSFMIYADADAHSYYLVREEFFAAATLVQKSAFFTERVGCVPVYTIVYTQLWP